jgi:DNA replication protein DnaC
VKQLPPNPKACRLLTDNEMDRLRSTGLTHWRNPEDCLTCGGAKVFKAPGGVETECDCVAQWILYHWMLNAGINNEYQRLSWDDMEAVDGTALMTVLEYADNLEYNLRIGRGLILWAASPGTGKTLLASALLKKILANGYDGYFTQFNEMLDIFTAGWRDEAERAWFIRRVRNTPILVVDDIGKEHKGRMEVAESMFDMVMRHRVASGLPTIITTNLTPDDIKAGYGMFVMSLLSEQCEQVEVPGTDYRDKKAESNRVAARDGIVRPFVAEG